MPDPCGQGNEVGDPLTQLSSRPEQMAYVMVGDGRRELDLHRHRLADLTFDDEVDLALVVRQTQAGVLLYISAVSYCTSQRVSSVHLSDLLASAPSQQPVRPIARRDPYPTFIKKVPASPIPLMTPRLYGKLTR